MASPTSAVSDMPIQAVLQQDPISEDDLMMAL